MNPPRRPSRNTIPRPIVSLSPPPFCERRRAVCGAMSAVLSALVSFTAGVIAAVSPRAGAGCTVTSAAVSAGTGAATDGVAAAAGAVSGPSEPVSRKFTSEGGRQA